MSDKPKNKTAGEHGIGKAYGNSGAGAVHGASGRAGFGKDTSSGAGLFVLFVWMLRRNALTAG